MQAHLVRNASQVAVQSMKMNNVLQVNAAALTDSFPSFAKKLHLALTRSFANPKTQVQRLNFCKQHDIRYNGALIHRTLLSAASNMWRWWTTAVKNDSGDWTASMAETC